jgi:hypothetical protein
MILTKENSMKSINEDDGLLQVNTKYLVKKFLKEDS